MLSGCHATRAQWDRNAKRRADKAQDCYSTPWGRRIVPGEASEGWGGGHCPQKPTPTPNGGQLNKIRLTQQSPLERTDSMKNNHNCKLTLYGEREEQIHDTEHLLLKQRCWFWRRCQVSWWMLGPMKHATPLPTATLLSNIIPWWTCFTEPLANHFWPSGSD